MRLVRRRLAATAGALLILSCPPGFSQDGLQAYPAESVVRRTTLIVADAEASIRFYSEIIGFERWYYNASTVTEGSLPAVGADVGDPSIFAIMKGRDPWIGMVGLLQKGEPQQRTKPETFAVVPGDTILMLETDDLDGIYQRMLDAGTPIWKHPQRTRVTGAGGREWDATFLFAFDPDGHLLEINQPHFDAAPTGTVRKAYADTAQGQVHYRSVGTSDNTPLTLLHQSPLSGRMYRHLLPKLSENRRVLAPDTPGYGESDPLPGQPSIEDYADTLIAWLDAMDVAKTDLFGYHTGAAIAVDIALRYPERVDRLILMSVPAFSAAERDDWALSELELQADGSHLLAMWESTYRHRAAGQTLDMVAATVAEKQRAGRHEWLALRALAQYPLLERLGELQAAVALINPHDGLRAQTEAARDALPAIAGYVERPDWQYGIFDTEATEIAELIEDFLTRTVNQAMSSKPSP